MKKGAILTVAILTLAGSAGVPAIAAEDPGITTLTVTDNRGNVTSQAHDAALAVEGSATSAEGSEAAASASASPSAAASESPSAEATVSTEATQSTATPTDGAGASAGEGAPAYSDFLYLSEPIATNGFSVAGVTWDQGQALPAGATVQMRTLDYGSWSQWYNLEVDEGGSTPGTEPYISGNSTGVQVRITGTGALPSGLTVSMLDGSRNTTAEEIDPEPAAVAPAVGSEDDGAAAQVADSTTSATPSASVDSITAGLTSSGTGMSLGAQPAAATSAQLIAAAQLGKIHPRSEWKPDDSIMTWTPHYAKLEGAIVHHTAGSNNYTESQVPGLIRAMYNFHTVTRGWGDIGYNVIIDKFGGRWEGRTGTLSSAPGTMAVGGHAKPMNTGTIGVSVMGTFMDDVYPSSTIVTAISEVIASQFAKAGVDPSSKSPLLVPPSTSTGLTVGSSLPRIAGHKDVWATACPGNIYGYLPQIRTKVQTLYSSIMAITSYSNEAASSSTYYLNNAWSSTASITFEYGTSSNISLAGDWDGDGKDTVALRNGNAFALNNTTYPASSTPTYTTTYGTAGDEYYYGDWDGDGKDTPAVRRGNAFYLKNSWSSGAADRVITYGTAGDVILVGDWDGDGKDTFVVRRGNQYLVRNTLTSGVAEQTIAYGKSTDAVLVGHFGGLKRDSLTVRRGNTYYISSYIHDGDADRVLTYGRVDDVALVGDWDGNKVDTLGVRRG